MSTIVTLIIQLIGGVIGGNATGSAMKNANLGPAGNSIVGAIGGIGLDWLLPLIIPSTGLLSANSLDIGTIVAQLVGGGVGGAVLTGIVGLVRKSMAPAS